MKIGIFGGTFDPVHNEHIRVAKHAKESLGLDKVVVLPSGDPPHKNSAIASKEQRLKMCELAFDFEGFEISDFELAKEGKSYTFETLEHFANNVDELFLIIGGDSMRDINEWKNPERIFELATVAVIARKPYSIESIKDEHKEKIVVVNYSPSMLSSTEVRTLVEFDLPIKEYVPSLVEKYIQEEKLYWEARETTTKVKSLLEHKRYLHTCYTTISALKLAKEAGVDKDKAKIAAILHDVAKNFTSFEEYKPKLEKENILMPAPVIHAFVGSYFIKKEFKINDKDIRNAVKYHTTARPNMSQLEKLIYTADCVEDTRKFSGVEELRELVYKDFEKGFIMCLANSNNLMEDKTMCPLTLDAIDFYMKKN